MAFFWNAPRPHRTILQLLSIFRKTEAIPQPTALFSMPGTLMNPTPQSYRNKDRAVASHHQKHEAKI